MVLSLQKGVSHKLTTKWKRGLACDRKYNQKSILEVSSPRKCEVLSLLPEGSFWEKGFLWSPLSRALAVRRYSSSTGQTSLLLSQCQIGICTSPRHLLRLPQSNHPSLAYFVCHPTSWDSRFCSLKALAPSLQPALPHLPLHLASGTCEQLSRSG